MPVTLEQAKLNVQDALQIGVIDEFQKSNFLLRNLTFDDAVSPTGGGATLTYAYTRLLTQPTASFRAINTEYSPAQVEKKRITVDLKVFGGSFEVDRIIANMGGIVNEVTLQMQQKIKAAQALFNNTVINGDAGQDANAFDGLDKAITGSLTEVSPSAAIDLSDSAKVDANYKAFLDLLDEFISKLDGQPTALLGNTKMISKLRAIARRATMYRTDRDNYGVPIEWYGNIPFIDLGAKPGSNADVVATNDQGETSLYAVRLGLDGVHAISMAGHPPVNAILPDFKTAGAVKKGEVEMVAAIALKAQKAAGVLRKIKVS